MNNFFSTNPTTLNLSSLISVRGWGGGGGGGGRGGGGVQQLTVRDTDRLSDNK